MQANDFLSFLFGYIWCEWRRSAPPSGVMVRVVSWTEENGGVVHPLR